MKLSNKILIGLIVFIFLYLSAAFAELGLTGTPTVVNENNSIAETADIPPVKYVVVNNVSKNIFIVGSDRSQLEVRSFKGNLLSKLNYQVSGDTLEVMNFDFGDRMPARVTVYVPKTIQEIHINRSGVEILELDQPELRITEDAGKIWMSDTRIGRLYFRGSNGSLCDISSSNLDTLSAELEGSNLQLFSPVKVAEGFMKDHSNMRLLDVEDIQFKKDRSSKLNLYQ